MFDIRNWLSFEGIKDLILNGWSDFRSMDLSQVKYSDINLAIFTGAVIIGLVILKLIFTLFGWKKHAWADSGHLIDIEEQEWKDEEGNIHKIKIRKSFLAKVITILPSLALSVFFTAILFAVANPFLTNSGEEKKYIETRTRVDLRDISSSMSSFLPDTRIPGVKLAMDAHLKFLEMRAGKGDRTSFWLFSDNGYMVNDFITDDKLQYLQAYDAPWGFSSTSPTGQNPTPEFPYSRYAIIIGEGGTVLGNVLRGVIEQFDRDENIQKKSPGYRPNRGRSVVVYSDSDIFDVDRTKEQINELVKRRIAIYVVLVDTRPQQSKSQNPYETNPFLLYVLDSGGKFFIAADINSMIQAHMEIDRLEKTSIQINKKTIKTLLFDKFIFISIIALIGIIPAGLFNEVFFRDYP